MLLLLLLLLLLTEGITGLLGADLSENIGCHWPSLLSVHFTTCSGAHFNPAVTCGAFIAGKINVLAVPLYIVSQLAGALCGSLLVLVGIHALHLTITINAIEARYIHTCITEVCSSTVSPSPPTPFCCALSVWCVAFRWWVNPMFTLEFTPLALASHLWWALLLKRFSLPFWSSPSWAQPWIRTQISRK